MLLWWVLFFFFLCVVNLLLHQKGWRPRKGKQHARLKDFMCRKKDFFFPMWFATYFLFQTYRNDVVLSDKMIVLLWCVMWCACVSKHFHTHHKHTLVVLRTLKGKKHPFITSLLWSRSVMELCSIWAWELCGSQNPNSLARPQCLV